MLLERTSLKKLHAALPQSLLPPAITLASRDMTFRLFGGAAAIPGTRLENSGNAQQTGHRQYGTVAHQGYQ